MGYPDPVRHGRIFREHNNLCPGWVMYDFARAFRKPVKVINDAAMHALSSYQGV